MRSSTLPKVLGVLAGAMVLAVLIGWWASRTPSPKEMASQPPTPVTETVVEPASTPTPAPRSQLTFQAAPEIVTTDVSFDPALWEERLDEILGDASDDSDRQALELLDMMDKVSTEAQTEIAGHIINLLDDKDYHMAAKYLTNAEVPEAVSSIFMGDLYNRDETLKLPLLLVVARNEKHALHEEAKDLLELYVEEDYGDDWVKWEEATNKYLKEHEAELEATPATP